jgi:hypothetical protein
MYVLVLRRNITSSYIVRGRIWYEVELVGFLRSYVDEIDAIGREMDLVLLIRPIDSN